MVFICREAAQRGLKHETWLGEAGYADSDTNVLAHKAWKTNTGNEKENSQAVQLQK